MPTYIYETTDTTKPRREFFVKQSVHDDPLKADPETGEPARRIISAGYNRVASEEKLSGSSFAEATADR